MPERKNQRPREEQRRPSLLLHFRLSVSVFGAKSHSATYWTGGKDPEREPCPKNSSRCDLVSAQGGIRFSFEQLWVSSAYMRISNRTPAQLTKVNKGAARPSKTRWPKQLLGWGAEGKIKTKRLISASELPVIGLY